MLTSPNISILRGFVLAFVFLFIVNITEAQLLHIGENEYIDTIGKIDSVHCKELNIYYYQVEGKYPESSYVLLENAQAYIGDFTLTGLKNGYITFRFTIDCQGNLVRFVEVLQTNQHYKKDHFEFGFVKELYQFLLTLKDWKIAKLNGDTYPYKAYLTFKIKDGKVDNIIP